MRYQQANSSNVFDKYEYRFSDIFPLKAIYLVKPREEFVIPCFVSTGYTLAVQKRREKSRSWDTVIWLSYFTIIGSMKSYCICNSQVNYNPKFSSSDYRINTWAHGAFEGIMLFELLVKDNGEYRCVRERKSADQLTSYSKSFFVSIIQGQSFYNTVLICSYLKRNLYLLKFASKQVF